MQYFEMSPLPLASNMGVPSSGGGVYNRQGGSYAKQTNHNSSYYYGAYYNPQTASLSGEAETYDNKTGGAYNISSSVGSNGAAVAGGAYQQTGSGQMEKGGARPRASLNSVENHFGPPTETLSMYENGECFSN